MLSCILKNIPKYVIKNYFQIVPLVSKLLLSWFYVVYNIGYKRLKILYVFVNHYIDSNFYDM
jgi:hypothetical protein